MTKWNYSTDCHPTLPENIPADRTKLYRTKASAVRACKSWCKSEGIEYDESMVASVEA